MVAYVGWVNFFRGKKFDFYDFICKYVKRLICLSSNIARKRYHEIKSFVNNGPLWKHSLNYFFFNYTFFYCVVRNYRASFVKYMKSLKVSW